jgi:hypothetical protein
MRDDCDYIEETAVETDQGIQNFQFLSALA